MSRWVNELVPRVSPRGTYDIARLAEYVLSDMQPGVFRGAPHPTDIIRLVEGPFQEDGLHFYPEKPSALDGREAAAIITASGPIEVLIIEDQWHEAHHGGRQAFRGRATLAHESGHAFLHVGEVRRRGFQLARGRLVSRQDIPAYEDPEWQAWTFAGALLMPLPILRTMGDRRLAQLSETFQVSEDFARETLRRFARFL